MSHSANLVTSHLNHPGYLAQSRDLRHDPSPTLPENQATQARKRHMRICIAGAALALGLSAGAALAAGPKTVAAPPSADGCFKPWTAQTKLDFGHFRLGSTRLR